MQLHLLPNLAEGGSEWSASRPGRFTAEGQADVLSEFGLNGPHFLPGLV